ncbi:putative RNA-directed DNA polymerase from transposon X-element [Nephila pilipes]|uniref:Putative RNA-directed DNA polymerase from transposon X-element n=1 Tax=Nephila pilipes TaxID=299642 RepID=A0A8X6N9C2_NEPPI|nr:putative RNA-directed DNA polymerase from transposon X-element [Nephila pilipes]
MTVQAVLKAFKRRRKWTDSRFPDKQWIEKCYPDSCPSKATICRWFAEFKCGRTDTNDAERSGRPVEAVTPENSQLEYADGGRGDTWMEVDLRYPGMHNRNITKGHEWAVYVNQVAHDAVEKVESSRCISAGFRWNPYIVKSDDDLYKSECNIDNPYRCEMGDLSGRLGPMEIGTGRRVFTDVNLPLVGNYSVMGRSIVIFQKEGQRNKLSCANILPDIHLVRLVTVKKNPGFTVSRFMEHMRQQLDTKDWLVVQDTQSQREILDGQCVQLTIHFYGPDAHRLQIEFSNLINLGSVRKDTRLGLKLIETYYKPCRNLNDVNMSVLSRASQFMILLGIFMCTLLQRRLHL